MTKPKSNSILGGLPANQREQLTAWLFEENISYKDAVDRLWKDFAVRCSRDAVADYYQRTAQERMLDRIAASRTNANLVVSKFRDNPADMQSVLIDMVGQIAFEKSMQGGKQFDPETIFNFTKLVLANRKQAMQEDLLKLQKDKFQFDAAAACLKHLPTLRTIAAKTGIDQKEKIQNIRQLLFGEVAS